MLAKRTIKKKKFFLISTSHGQFSKHQDIESTICPISTLFRTKIHQITIPGRHRTKIQHFIAYTLFFSNLSEMSVILTLRSTIVHHFETFCRFHKIP